MSEFKDHMPKPLTPLQMLACNDEYTYYNMRHSKRGHAIIFLFNCLSDCLEINGEMIPFAKEQDKAKIKDTILHLNFEPTMIHICEDYSKQDIQNKLFSVANMDHTKNDCLLVVMSTHGDKKIHFCKDPKPCVHHCEQRELLFTFKNGQQFEEMDTEILWEPFTGDKCQTLRGKPKLFFIQACRGKEADPGVDGHVSDVEMEWADRTILTTTPSRKMSCEIDFLIARSCTTGTMSYSENGGWFTQVLCDYLLKDGHNDDLLSILTKVTNEIDKLQMIAPFQPDILEMKQTTETTTRLRKKLLFVPK